MASRLVADHHVDAAARLRFVTGLFALFGAAALALSAIGLHAVLSYAVSRRRREFGVRLALGARRRDVLALVLRDGLRLVLAGVAVGALLSLWTSQLLEAWLYDVPATDVLALGIAELALAGIALLASLAPALRAARSAPLEVLRAV